MWALLVQLWWLYWCKSPWSMWTTRCCSLDGWFRVTAGLSVISTSDCLCLWVTTAIMRLQHACVLQRVPVIMGWTPPRRCSVALGQKVSRLTTGMRWLNPGVALRGGAGGGGGRGGSPARPLTCFQQCQESWSWLTATVHQCFFQSAVLSDSEWVEPWQQQQNYTVRSRTHFYFLVWSGFPYSVIKVE